MKDVVTIQIVGKAKTVKLKTENPVIKSYLTISSEEEKRVSRLQSMSNTLKMQKEKATLHVTQQSKPIQSDGFKKCLRMQGNL